MDRAPDSQGIQPPPRHHRCHSSSGLDGIRPSRESVARLRVGLEVEGRALHSLRAAQGEVRDALSAARSEGATYTAIAAALVPGTGNVGETARMRERVAAALRARAFQGRRRREFREPA